MGKGATVAVERLNERLRRMAGAEDVQPVELKETPRSPADRELQRALLDLDRRVTSLEREMGAPLWSLISVLVALALSVAGGQLL